MNQHTETQYIVGLDLGQAKDPTAISILEKVIPFREEVVQVTPVRADFHQVPEPAVYHCTHLDRFALRTSYPKIVDQVAHVMRDPRLRDAKLIVDATGVGRPVVDMIRDAGLSPIGVIITGGDSESSGEGLSRVPKRNLVSIIQILLQERRLVIADGLSHAATLVNELLNFQVKINDKAHDSYGAWRESVHDDLVLATALAAWWGERNGGITVDSSAWDLLTSL